VSFSSEAEFEQHIRELILTYITSKHPHIYALDNKKAVDIIICRDLPLKPALFFLEVKYHKASHGRLGFGSAKGGGFQPEIVSKKTTYFEQNLRWVLGEQDAPGIILTDSSTIRNYVSGGTVGKKFNNIQKRIFQEQSKISDDVFLEELSTWLGVE